MKSEKTIKRAIRSLRECEKLKFRACSKCMFCEDQDCVQTFWYGSPISVLKWVLEDEK